MRVKVHGFIHFQPISRRGKKFIQTTRMASLAIREDIQHFVDEILQWDFYTDIIDDHDDSEGARARLAHGSTFQLYITLNPLCRCGDSFDPHSFQEFGGICGYIRSSVLTGVHGADS